MKRLIRKILREEIEKTDRHYRILDIVSDHVQLPYFDSMEGLTIDDRGDQLYVMKKILGNDIRFEYAVPSWEGFDEGTMIYDNKGNELYWEDSSDGYWMKQEYDDNGNRVYWENYHGGWWKYEYDDRGNKIYYESSNGYWVKWEYDDRGNRIYYESSDGLPF
jgi:hypothetical protein